MVLPSVVYSIAYFTCVLPANAVCIPNCQIFSQGSAHTGPALTPVEVLVAIHGIVPEKDGIALKKAR